MLFLKRRLLSIADPILLITKLGYYPGVFTGGGSWGQDTIIAIMLNAGKIFSCLVFDELTIFNHTAKTCHRRNICSTQQKALDAALVK